MINRPKIITPVQYSADGEVQRGGTVQIGRADSPYQLADFLLKAQYPVDDYPQGVPRDTVLPQEVWDQYHDLKMIIESTQDSIFAGRVHPNGSDKLARSLNRTLADVIYDGHTYHLSDVMIDGPNGDASFYYVLFQDDVPQYILPENPVDMDPDELERMVLISYNGLDHAGAMGIIKATLGQDYPTAAVSNA